MKDSIRRLKPLTLDVLLPFDPRYLRTKEDNGQLFRKAERMLEGKMATLKRCRGSPKKHPPIFRVGVESNGEDGGNSFEAQMGRRGTGSPTRRQAKLLN